MSEALAVSQVIAGVDAALRAAAEGELPASLAAEAETALAEAEQTGLPTLIARAAACLARVLTRTGRPREALKPVNRGRAALVGASAYFAQVELALAEAEAHRTVALAEDDQCAWRAALAACRQALPAVEHGRLGADAPHLQAGFMRGNPDCTLSVRTPYWRWATLVPRYRWQIVRKPAACHTARPVPTTLRSLEPFAKPASPRPTPIPE